MGSAYYHYQGQVAFELSLSIKSKAKLKMNFFALSTDRKTEAGLFEQVYVFSE